MQMRLANSEVQEDCLNLLALLARYNTESVALIGQSGGFHAVETTEKGHPLNETVKPAVLGLLFSIAACIRGAAFAEESKAALQQAVPNGARTNEQSRSTRGVIGLLPGARFLWYKHTRPTLLHNVFLSQLDICRTQ
jgi:hypothetical protein